MQLRASRRAALQLRVARGPRDNKRMETQSQLSEPALDLRAANDPPTHGLRPAPITPPVTRYIQERLGRAIRLRRRMEANQEALEVRVWLFPWVSLLCAAAIVAVLVTMAFTPDQFIQVALCAAVFAASVAACFVRARLGPRHVATAHP